MIESPGQVQADAGRGPARIVLAHDWLCGFRGGEAVLERLAALIDREFEGAALLAMFDDGRPLSPTVDAWRSRGLVRSSSLNRWPGSGSLRRWMLPLYPRTVGDLSRRLAEIHAQHRVDLVVSTSSAAIKGLRPPAGIPHLCYCHAPARYIWSQRGAYGGGGAAGTLRRLGLAAYGGRFKAWDRATAANVTRFLANSTHTASEIRRCFGREADVVTPPVRTGYFTVDPSARRGMFWLVVSALEPYKRIDLAIDGAREAGVELVIVGDGSQRRSLQSRAAGRATFLGRVDDARLRDLYRTAALFIAPQVEDFGIATVEAQACGLPVVARRAGGALDIVVEGRTGAFFGEATPAALVAAAMRVPERCTDACRANAERFGEAAFDGALLGHMRRALAVPSRTA